MINVLILGAGGPAGINLARCLRMSKHALRLIGADMSPFRLQLPDLDVRCRVDSCRAAIYHEQVSDIVRREHVDFVFAQPDVEVLELARNSGYGAATALPAISVIEICQNKYSTYCHLSGRVSVPATIEADHINDTKFEALARENRKVWVRSRFGAGSHAAAPASSLEEMKWWINYCCNHKKVAARDFIVAEYLPGNDYAWQGVWWKGQFLGGVTRKRLEYAAAGLSPSGQSSSASLAVIVDEPFIENLGKSAVLALSKTPTGSFGVDMKCRGDGTACITEINAGRFYTTCNFHAACGLNLPDALLASALGLPAPTLIPSKAGLMWIRSMDRDPKIIEGTSNV
jgi:carbamoyl-phosphate synthase large subunit